MNDFAELLADLETLQKASGADCDDKDKTGGDDSDKDGAGDKKIDAAAKDGEKQSDADKETFGKAFEVTLADGSKAEAFDGTAMLKALHTEHEVLQAAFEDRQGDILKAFDIAVGTIRTLQTQVAQQDTLIKALTTKVNAVSSTGVGRRTMLTIAEKLAPSAGINGDGGRASGPSADDVMAKAKFLVREGKFDAGQLPRLEAHHLRGMLGPDDLMKAFPELLTPIR